MAVVRFPKKEFEKVVGKLTEKTKEKISMFGTPLESIDDSEIEIEIFPNRPDLLSMQGYIRSFLAFLGKKTGLKKYKLNKPEKDYEVRIDKSVLSIRPFTACAIVKNLKFDDEKIKEVIDIQEKIHSTLGRDRRKIAIGIYPLEKIKLPIKYEARSPEKIKFIPLEENKEMTGMEVLQKTQTGREYAHLLEGASKFPVFIDSAGEVLSMPPIINSEKTGKITEQTKQVFIECSGFELSILKKTLNTLVTMFADMGGRICQMKLRYHNTKPELTPDLTPEKLKINLDNCNKLLGLKLKDKEIKKLLAKMGYNYNAGIVEIPAWRTDILHEVDIFEDIAIAYGYDNFKPEIPPISTIGKEDKREVKKRKISQILTGLGLIELSTYHLLTKQDAKKAGIKEKIEVEKSKTDYKILRSNLLCSVLKTLSENVDAEYPQKIFEIGKVFSKDEESETGIKEKDNLIIAITPGGFTEIKQILLYLAKMLNIKIGIKEVKEEIQQFITGRVGEIFINENKKIGIIGEIHPSVLKSWHLKMPVALLEIDLREILID